MTKLGAKNFDYGVLLDFWAEQLLLLFQYPAQTTGATSS